MKNKSTSLYSIIKSLGLVFGDIGTSPIYTLTVIFLITPHSQENIIGVLSLIIIAVVLFSVKVSALFGPLMVIWFSALTLSGLIAILAVPSVFKAINPYYGIHFLLKNGFAGFFVLSEVTLCATGGEALYADMGHLGREPIVKAWYFVLVALILNYLGQGAFLIHHPEAKNVLFAMVFFQAKFLYIPFLILSIIATVIASQAMISGMFSIVYQGIATRIMPMLKIAYTSTKLRSQVYIGFVNWFLLFSVLLIMIEFRESSRLAAAYGRAATGTMTITGIMMSRIFWLRQNKCLSIISLIIMMITFGYFLSNTFKISHGGYWSIIIASIPFGIIILYRHRQKRLFQALLPMPLSTFLEAYREIYLKLIKIIGSALFFAKDSKFTPLYRAYNDQ